MQPSQKCSLKTLSFTLILLLSSIATLKIQESVTNLAETETEATMRDNWVHMQDLRNISFNARIYATSGQPTGKASGQGDWVNVQAGRKASTTLARVVNAYLNPRHASTFGHTAGKLNFLAIGSLSYSLKGSRYTVSGDAWFAQGRSGSSNNWWFGGRNCKRVSFNDIWGDIVQCPTTNGRKHFFVRGKAWTKCEQHGVSLPTHTAVNSVRVFDNHDEMKRKMDTGSEVYCHLKTAFDVIMTFV